MAESARRLFVNLETKKLVFSDRIPGEVILADFHKYETAAFEVVLLRRNPNALTGALERVNISNVSLKISIHSSYDTSSPAAMQDTWSKDLINNVFSAEFSLNTAGINSLIGANATATGYFEIEITENTSRQKIYVQAITLRNAVAQPSTTAPTPITEYMTRAEADSKYVKFLGSAGETVTLTSSSGTFQRIIGVTDGGEPIDQILPV